MESRMGCGGSDCRKGSPRGKETKLDSALKGEARLRLAEKRARECEACSALRSGAEGCSTSVSEDGRAVNPQAPGVGKENPV